VDPVDTARALSGLDPETTLAIVVSKTFTTAETMLNARTVKQWLIDGFQGKDVDAAAVTRQHMVAVRYASAALITICVSMLLFEFACITRRIARCIWQRER
jgi:glucose-6-phosphate isomerase